MENLMKFQNDRDAICPNDPKILQVLINLFSSIITFSVNTFVLTVFGCELILYVLNC